MLAGPRLRLGALVAGLIVLALCVHVLDLVSVADVRRWADGFGPLAPPAYVAIAGLLGALLVPGALLAGAAGALFGAGIGTLVSVCAAVCSSVIAVAVARRAGSEGMQELSGERLRRLAVVVQHRGVAAVALQRLLPAVPDAPASYAFGALGVRIHQIALGTLVGAAPRAFSYAALGASLDDPESPLAVAGVAGLVLTGLLGAGLGRRALRRSRRQQASGLSPTRPAA